MPFLYRLYEMQSLSLMPFKMMGDLTQSILSHPLHPVSNTAFGRSFTAGWEVFDSLTRQRAKPEWNIDTVICDDTTYSVQVKTKVSKDFCDLSHFEKVGCSKQEPKVLVVAPMSGHHATLLRGTVHELLKDHDVYITDWRDSRFVSKEHGEFGLAEYVRYLLDFLEHFKGDVHVIAVCQPAPLVLAAVSLLAAKDSPHQPKSMTLMGGPVDPRAEPTAVTRFAESKPLFWFEKNFISEVPFSNPGAGRRVYPGFLQLGGFLSMNPARHFDAHVKMFHHLVEGDGDSLEAHNAFYDEYMAVMDVPARYYLDTISMIFKDYLLPKGELVLFDQKVDPGTIKKTALMTVEGEKDDISAPGQTLAAQTLCTGLTEDMRDHWLQPNVGHYGIFNGRRWREIIKPRIAAFIQKNA